MKNLKKLLKWTGILLGLIVLVLFSVYLIYNESKPVGQSGPEADALANKMFMAINKNAWDSTAIIQWTFKGMHDFVWDKDRNLVKVSWDDKVVLLDTKSVSGKAFENGVEVSADKADKLVKAAWSYFCNDSFWLNAPAKAFDPGTERSIVKLEDGGNALMVTYTSGGVTPGDSYLWILDENGLPKSWKMWVSIIPIGGIEFTWENWMDLSTGARIASLHHHKLIDLDISNLKAGTSLSSFGLKNDPFVPIITE